jgi:hypothetical protein
MPRASRYLELQGITGTALRATPCAGLALYGRRLWETMSSHRPTGDQQRVKPAAIEFARRWRDMSNVVFSSTTSMVDWNTRLVTGDAVTEITRLKAEDGGPHGDRWRHARRGRKCEPD